MFEVKLYEPSMATAWDEFVSHSRNATFLHKRGYMDYHADRFSDHSLVFFSERGTIAALLPANERNGELFSHGGLTYGGLLLSAKTSATHCMELVDELIAYMRKNSLSKLHYKQIPTIYHRLPSQDDEYALWRHGAQLEVCNMATAIDLRSPMGISVERRRKRGLRMAEEQDFTLCFNAPVSELWSIVESNLKLRYDTRPVHTLSEMELLASRFPNNIKCVVARNKQGIVEGGVVLYISNEVVHAQYGHATPEGYDHHVMDLVYSSIIQRAQSSGFHFFDFGTSNEQSGRYLNPSLISLKEGFGGHGIAYKQWVLSV